MEVQHLIGHSTDVHELHVYSICRFRCSLVFHLYENIMPNKEESNEELMRYASDLSIELHPFRQILSKPYSSDEWLLRNVRFYQEVYSTHFIKCVQV